MTISTISATTDHVRFDDSSFLTRESPSCFVFLFAHHASFPVLTFVFAMVWTMVSWETVLSLTSSAILWRSFSTSMSSESLTTSSISDEMNTTPMP